MGEQNSQLIGESVFVHQKFDFAPYEKKWTFNLV